MNITQRPKPEWEEKVWGRTRLIMRGQNFEIHELQVKPGGYCSRHRHKKRNLFHVMSGVLTIEIFGNGDKPTDIPTWSGNHIGDDQCEIAAGDWHRFKAAADGEGAECIEVYWTLLLSDDIERADVGGLELKQPYNLPE